MTLRLIALMALVLGLSLAAFAVLIGRYQQRVMAEVESIVSEVGRATVRTTMEMHRERDPDPAGNRRTVGGDGDRQHLMRWVDEVVTTVDTKRDGGQQEGVTRAPSGVEESVDDPTGQATVWFFSDGDPPRVVDIGRQATRSQHDEAIGSFIQEFELEQHGSGDVVGRRRVIVRLEDVHAESDPTGELFLRIPRRLHSEGTGPDVASRRLASADDADGSGATGEIMHDIVLPVPTEKLAALATATRRQSLLLFIAVLGVGTMLSAGFAHRFTRPVRRLDAGLHRLSEGDLDVEVDVRGGDEIGRLGRAFNEMARRLRAGRERAREMARREKLAALGRLAAGVAHDVRNPLHSIGLTLQHLRETSRPTAEAPAAEFDRSLDLIRGEILRLDQLVTNFLGFARSDPSARDRIDPPELLTEVGRLVEREAERAGITVLIDADPDTPAIEAVPGSIRSAVLNLVLNSFEATPSGGRVTLSARAAEPDGDTPQVVLEVTDTGRGIPLEEQERVFEFSYSTREDGHGLGLAMVHQVVVEDHAGRVDLESRAGEGTTVRMTLPGIARATDEERS